MHEQLPFNAEKNVSVPGIGDRQELEFCSLNLALMTATCRVDFSEQAIFYRSGNQLGERCRAHPCKQAAHRRRLRPGHIGLCGLRERNCPS